MEARDQELKKELDATLHARRELGEEYESALVESFLSKVEQRIDGVVDRRTRRQLAENRTAVARGTRSPRQPAGSDSGFGERFGFGVVSLILAVPLSAIGVVNAGLPGLIVTWAGIVGVNVAHSSGGLSRLFRKEERRDSDSWMD
ncbi:hypothetical protein GCM10010232_00760 [Streptomyces amakusaensis]|uniref:Integral membrane protein n=1 Tax=Streptomyces amakusaensis TaxID=67271 RepID=A0ABW0AQ37_9ACTN